MATPPHRFSRGLRTQALSPLALGVLTVLLTAGQAPAQLRIANYNTARLQGSTIDLRHVFGELGDDNTPGFAQPPHLVVFQEVNSGQLSTLLSLMQQAHPGIPYAAATYTNAGEDPVGGAQAALYRTDLLLEDAGAHADIFTGAGRFADRWRFRLVDYGAANSDAAFYIYGMHLKASPGSENEQIRLDGINAVRANAASLPAGTHILYAGDFNFYSPGEPGYVALTAAGTARGIDPHGNGSWSGSGHAIRHTQSPRLTSSGGLVGGGMDDRFDFQFLTAPFNDGAGLTILQGTYRSLGNDGLHYGTAINQGNNFYFAGNVSRSNALADALHGASDHVPVVVDYRIPGRISAAIDATFGTVLQGASVGVELLVSNDAPVVVAYGAESFEYAAAGTGALSGTQAGSAAALAAPNVHVFAVNTLSTGFKTGAVQVSSNNQGVGRSPTIVQTSGTVLLHARPSFQSDADVAFLQVTADAVADGPTIEIDVRVHNAFWTSMQAALDIDAVTGSATEPPFALVSGVQSGITATPGIVRFAFDPTGAAPGQVTAFSSIAVSDEDLPGALSGTLIVAVALTVSPAEDPPGPPGDLDGNGVVNFNDLLELLSAWGPCPPRPEPCPADLDGNGTVDFSDVLILLGNWG